MKNSRPVFLLSLSLFALSLQAEPPLLGPLQYNEQGFALATPGVELQFPRDHGSHPEFKTEWWYLTGHFEDSSGAQRYSFQLTFFRSAAAPNGEQSFLAHAALLDHANKRYLHEERLNSDLWNAGAADGQLDLYNGNWNLRMEEPDTELMSGRFSIQQEAIVRFKVRPLKEKILFGKEGYSQKSEQSGDASYYITHTRLELEGQLQIAGENLSIKGLAWMDHEFSSSQLGPNQIGWKWTSLQFHDGSELMAYVMRRDDGKRDPHSTLVRILPNGTKRTYASDQFTWTARRYWPSPYSGGNYPVAYSLTWNEEGEERAVDIEPFIDSQEFRGQYGEFNYWEGAFRALDSEGIEIGQGYTELTGYDQSLNGKF